MTVGAFVVQDILGQETVWGSGHRLLHDGHGVHVPGALAPRYLAVDGPGSPPATFAAGGGLVAAVGAERGWLAVFLLGVPVRQRPGIEPAVSTPPPTSPNRSTAARDEQGRVRADIRAVFGPLLVGPAEHAGQAWFGWERYTGRWLFSSVLFGLAPPTPWRGCGRIRSSSPAGSRLATMERVRTSIAPEPGAIRGRPRPALPWRWSSGRGDDRRVMTMTPVHMRLHGRVDEPVRHLLHIAGMFAFSPLVGATRIAVVEFPPSSPGRFSSSPPPSLALSGDMLLLFQRYGLGLGWCFGLIGGSTLLTESVPEQHRVAVRGRRTC